ncbi:MAG: endonuclease/exonuclease/phosphatase family protein [Polynucleobacter sp.]
MKFSVLQWNIWYKEDLLKVAEFIKSTKADVICLQELSIDNPDQTVKDGVRHIAEKLGYYIQKCEISIDASEMKLANAIFSKYPIKNSRNVWINKPTGSGHYDDEYRAYVEAELDIDGNTVTVGTVHMSYTNAFKPTGRKLEETKSLISAIQNNKSSFILTGDFNAKPDSEVIESISELLENAGPNSKENTWTTKPFSYDGFEANTLDLRFDYIFSTCDLVVKQIEVLKTELSDHLPILAEFELQ